MLPLCCVHQKMPMSRLSLGRALPTGGSGLPNSPPNRRWRVLAQLMVLIGIAEWAGSHFQSRYWLAFDLQSGEHCLLPSWFLVDRADHAIARGDYVSFTARGMTPFYPDGTRVVKRVVGIPGDHIVVDSSGVWINDMFSGPLKHVQPGGELWRRGHRIQDYSRNERVPAQRWWVMGTSSRSFDSRYWGYISDEQIIGRARALW